MRSLLSYIFVCKLIIHQSVSYGIFSIKTCKVVEINKHWLYNDEEIAQNMKKVEKYDELLKKYNIQDSRDLEKALKVYYQQSENVAVGEVEISEELMVQYGISSMEEFTKLFCIMERKKTF